MECKRCKEQMVLHAFSHGECEECGTRVVTPHLPCDKLCPDCSKDLGKCKSCGEDMKDDIRMAANGE